MTAILIVSDRDARRAVRGLYVIGDDPFVKIEQNDWDETTPEWTDPGYRVTCSADDGTCRRWGLDDTDRSLPDLIGNAETHVENHVRDKSTSAGDGMSDLYDCCDAAPTEPHRPDCGLARP